MKVSAVVICGNEEANIGDCLESVKWCDEIVVVDSMSTDRTPEIAKALAAADGVDGFRVKRHVHYLGRWINHGGWYPDWKVRLVRRGRAKWTGVDPHDKLVADGPTRDLDADLTHFTYRDYSHQLKTIDRFSDVVVEEWIKEGRKPSLFKLLFHPPVKFLECYVWKLGFLDGWAGFVIAKASAFYVFTKQVKLRERTKTSSKL